jgi:hypothetical protein
MDTSLPLFPRDREPATRVSARAAVAALQSQGRQWQGAGDETRREQIIATYQAWAETEPC